jgi:hypothetical protein
VDGASSDLPLQQQQQIPPVSRVDPFFTSMMVAVAAGQPMSAVLTRKFAGATHTLVLRALRVQSHVLAQMPRATAQSDAAQVHILHERGRAPPNIDSSTEPADLLSSGAGEGGATSRKAASTFQARFEQLTGAAWKDRSRHERNQSGVNLFRWKLVPAAASSSRLPSIRLGDSAAAPDERLRHAIQRDRAPAGLPH